MEHSGDDEIAREPGSSRYLLDPVDPRNASADELELALWHLDSICEILF
jgi:hypothetical protein